MPAQQKEIIPVQMGSVPEKCTLVDCLSHPFPPRFAGLKAGDSYPGSKSFIGGNCKECSSIIYRSAAHGDFALDCVQVYIFPRFWKGLVKSRCNSLLLSSNFLLSSKALRNYSMLIMLKINKP